tara:strand:- start:497 stop:1429 length:933 start_codon:yes stop_codon:yes gene_type:complete
MLDLNEVNQWKNNGYVIKSNIIENDLITKSIEFLKSTKCENMFVNEFGSNNNQLEFPTGFIIDKITINQNIIKCVKQLLNTDDILLAQSDAWRKTDKNSLNSDQRMHMDYGNNTFLHPSDWHIPEAVAIIIYFSDINDTGGGTAIVPKQKDDDELYKPPYVNMPGYGNLKFYNNKSQAEEYLSKFNGVGKFRNKLYDREIITTPKEGDILFYRLDTWHRGTPLLKGKIRYVMNLLFKKKECNWINYWNVGLTKKMYNGFLEKMFTEMTPEQRSVLGVPKPGDKYWTLEKLEYLKARYPNINIHPYKLNIN